MGLLSLTHTVTPGKGVRVKILGLSGIKVTWLIKLLETDELFRDRREGRAVVGAALRLPEWLGRHFSVAQRYVEDGTWPECE